MNIMISAMEPSGYALGSALVREMRELRPEISLFGLGDESMAQAGVEVLPIQPVSAIWLFSVLRQAPRYLGILRAAFQAMRERKPSAVILIDSSGFHFYLAKAAKKLGIRVIYYVSPQIWAYNSQRIEKIRRWVDQLLVLYPFEERYYRDRGVSAVYVGHPLFSRSQAMAEESPHWLRQGRLLGILPGSRAGEIAKNLPLMLTAAKALMARFPDLYPVLSCAQPKLRPAIVKLLGTEPWPIIDQSTSSIFKHASIVLVKSGTATLEALMHATPAVVLYRISRFESWLARPWIESPFLALPNLLAGEKVLPEFLLHSDDARPIIDAAAKILDDQDADRSLRARLAELRRPFQEKAEASRAAALAVCEFLDSRDVR